MSDLLIKGMKIPKCCAGCDAEEYYENSYGDECGFFCPFGDKAYTSETRELKRLDDCPLIPVPPHGRLIDADALLMRINHEVMEAYMDGACYGAHPSQEYLYLLGEIIDDAPTVIPAEEGET